jgi:hypothetical protein
MVYSVIVHAPFVAHLSSSAQKGHAQGLPHFPPTEAPLMLDLRHLLLPLCDEGLCFDQAGWPVVVEIMDRWACPLLFRVLA